MKPVNGHLLIEPVKREGFMQSSTHTFEEIGIVLDIANDVTTVSLDMSGTNPTYNFSPVKIGDKVYFDSWLAAKYPKNKDEFYWLVKWEDVRAVEHVEQEPV